MMEFPDNLAMLDADYGVAWTVCTNEELLRIRSEAESDYGWQVGLALENACGVYPAEDSFYPNWAGGKHAKAAIQDWPLAGEYRRAEYEPDEDEYGGKVYTGLRYASPEQVPAELRAKAEAWAASSKAQKGR